jgi:CelD/BcsL family acetyltransferase involved in cellulose biosynthesis
MIDVLLDGTRAMVSDRSARTVKEYASRLLSADEAVSDSELCEAWIRLAGPPAAQTTLFRSPQWLAHCQARSPEKPHSLLAMRDADGALTGIAPVVVEQYVLSVSVKFRSLLQMKLSCARLLGGEPWAETDDECYDALFRDLENRYRQCEGILLPMLPVGGACWSYLHRSKSARAKYLIYSPEPACKYRSAVLPERFSEYVQQFKAKHRQTLRREVKRLDAHCGGRLHLSRFTTPAEAADFARLAAQVERGSWQHSRVGDRIDDTPQWRAVLADAAERGLLLGYVLMCGETPCAFVFGYRLHDAYHYVQVGYDLAFREWSPGTVCLYLLIEDLIKNEKAKLLSFGFGDHAYKETFGNAFIERAEVLLMRRSAANRLRVAAHAGTHSLVRLGKKLMAPMLRRR